MPFTLAHPAAVWPLKRLRCFTIIPLIIGSLTPDFASYLPRSNSLPNSHTFHGTLSVDLPLGYGLLLLFVALRTVITAPLWEQHRSFVRGAITQLIAAKRWWLLSIPSLLVGSWTHVLWDSFTHENRFMVRNLPVLQQSLAPDYEHPMQLYRVLQYGCSVFGVAILVLWYLSALRASGYQGTGHVWRKYTLASLVLMSLLAGVINALFIPPQWWSVYHLISTVLTTAMPVFAGLYMMTGMMISMRKQYDPSQS